MINVFLRFVGDGLIDNMAKLGKIGKQIDDELVLLVENVAVESFNCFKSILAALILHKHVPVNRQHQ